MSCIRLHVTAEGQTEQTFVKNVLAPHLASYNIFADARSVLTSKDKKAHREYRGGLISYQKARADIVAWLKEDRHSECRFTTMFDLYALPDDFPGYADATRLMDPYARVTSLEKAFGQDIDDSRFIPYIQLHEFEALILADPQQLDWEYLEHSEPIGKLVKMVGTQNPELINDGFETAPSKRILKEIPEYDKATAGVSVVHKIGLSRIQLKCSHFTEWLHKLEQENATI
jgi:Domain of unknown function (DUF4276)